MALLEKSTKLGNDMCQVEGFHKVEVTHFVISPLSSYDSLIQLHLIAQNFIWKISQSYMDRILSYNKLHVFDNGVWGSHAWHLLKGAILCLPKAKQSAFERRYDI